MKTGKGNLTGTKYFFVHACVEIVCFYLLRVHYPAVMAGAIALSYDFVAFLPQGFIGDFIIKHKKIPYETDMYPLYWTTSKEGIFYALQLRVQAEMR